MDDNKSEKISECPYCGSDEGYFDRNVVRYHQYFDYNNEPVLASEMQYVSGGKRQYCISCERDITEKLKI